MKESTCHILFTVSNGDDQELTNGKLDFYSWDEAQNIVDQLQKDNLFFSVYGPVVNK